MDIDQIREKLADKISSSDEWMNQLDDVNPGHYGIEEYNVSMGYEDIWVDIPNKSFSFKNANFDFTLLLGSSNHDDGMVMDFSKIAKGNGQFGFSGQNSVDIEILNIEFDMDLFSESEVELG